MRRVTVVALALALLWLLPAQAVAAKQAKAPEAPRFVEESGAAGLDHRYDGEWQFFVGGGVAAFDCDGDLRPDLFLAGGSEPASLFRNTSAVGGRLSFEPVASDVVELVEVTGAYPIDIDGDGITDLAVMRRGENHFLRGLGDCDFERANEAWGLDGGDDWSVAFSATWEPGSDLPTLAVGNYLTIEEPGVIPQCAESMLLRPARDGYGAAESLTPGHCTLSMLFSDWDRSGRRDLRVTNDRQYYSDGEDQLWRLEPGSPATPYGREDGWERLQVFGMGIASYDLTGDGYPEYYVTSMGDNKLQTLVDGEGQPTYGDIAYKARVTVPQPFAGGDVMPSTAWHAEFDDVNNDGSIDLYVSKGNVEAMPDHAANDPNNLLLGRPNGRFKEGAKAAGILDYERGRGAALVDLNLDGLLDLVQVNRRVGVALHRNVGSGKARSPKPMGNWLAVKASQPGPNRDAVGAWIEVKSGGNTMSRETTIGGGHAGGELGPVHFGLGGAERAQVRVRWPDGELTEWKPAGVNRLVVMSRGEDGRATLETVDQSS